MVAYYTRPNTCGFSLSLIFSNTNIRAGTSFLYTLKGTLTCTSRALALIQTNHIYKTFPRQLSTQEWWSQCNNSEIQLKTDTVEICHSFHKTKNSPRTKWATFINRFHFSSFGRLYIRKMGGNVNRKSACLVNSVYIQQQLFSVLICLLIVFSIKLSQYNTSKHKFT